MDEYYWNIDYTSIVQFEWYILSRDKAPQSGIFNMPCLYVIFLCFMKTGRMAIHAPSIA